MPTSSEIRQQFIDFFCKKHGHVNVPSSPVVPHDDPTLLFANAGMNQFKPYFLGTEKPPYKRVANTQKCIRAGGKHNDLDDVGKDTYHHTFFEMLGNWSFGDYFKKEAIAWAWELLTDVWKLDPTRLHVTVFEGDPANGIPRDDEAAGFWRAVGVPDDHIHLGNKKDNFWEMGETGPCGPCTEIHYDSTPDKSGAKLVNGGSDQVIEIWNNVFIQFNRNPDKSLTPLPAQHVDTGMGFERITKILQGKDSNYDTDVFAPIFEAIRSVTGAPPYGGKLDDLKDTAYRVIGDHIRTLTFAITDGAVPSNVGRGYVVRSVLRRAERYGWQVFGMREPFLYLLTPVVAKLMGSVFPELLRNIDKVQSIIESEEKGFLRTLGRGMQRFEDWITNSELVFANQSISEDVLQSKTVSEDEFQKFVHSKDAQLYREAGPKVIPGQGVFRLYTEAGFPPDMTRQMAIERGYSIDEARFQELMREHEERSKGKAIQGQVALTGELPQTDDTAKYLDVPITPKILGWVQENTVVQDGLLQNGESVALLLDRTSFYAEQGGQVGDKGVILSAFSGARFEVNDTKRLGNAVLHIGTLVEGALNVGELVKLDVDSSRLDIMRNHTATHLMNLALRQVLGGDVDQKGSLVDAEKTRFDFTHDKPLTRDEIRAVEDRVNQFITRDLPVTAVTVPLAEAKKIAGVRAVFGEKYPDPVRVVMVGPETPLQATHDDSIEFCGGTHMPRTGPIGLFKIVSQEGVAKGVRRVTAVTGRVAQDTVRKLTDVMDDLTTKFQCKPEELPARVEALQDEVKKLQAQLKKGATADLTGVVDKLLDAAAEIGGAKLIVGQLPPAPVDQVRTQIDRLRQKTKSAFIVFGWSDGEGKVPVIAALTNDLTAKGLKAGDIVKQVAAIVGGSGGGKPDLAQAGGKDATKLPEALKKAEELGRELLAK